MDTLLRDTHVVINLDHLAQNIQAIQGLIGEDVALCPVIKADGYGHGAIEVSRVALEEGCKTLAVATLTEALELRQSFKEATIFIMGHTPDRLLNHVVDNRLMPTIFTLEQGEMLSKLAKEKGVEQGLHIKYDTGFNRLGFQDCPESLQQIKAITKLPNLSVEGLFSHFALKDGASNEEQFRKFQQAVSQLEAMGVSFKYTHMCDSIAGVDYPAYRLSMIRPGALLYGLKSYKDPNFHLKQVMTFKSKISYLKKLSAGEGVSYDYLWEAKKDSLIATLPFGYADGYPRNMRDKGLVTVRGIQVPIIGVICMDQCMADVTEVVGVQVGDPVIIYGDGQGGTLDIHDNALLANTNKNELVARITRRVPKVYIQKGKVVAIKDQVVEGYK